MLLHWRKPCPFLTEEGSVLDILSWTWSPVPKQISLWTGSLVPRYPLWKKAFSLFDRIFLLDPESQSLNIFPMEQTLYRDIPFWRKPFPSLTGGSPALFLIFLLGHEALSRNIFYHGQEVLSAFERNYLQAGRPVVRYFLFDRKPWSEMFPSWKKALSRDILYFCKRPLPPSSPRRFQFLELTKACLLILWSCDPTDVKAAGREGAVISTYWWI